MKNDHFKRLIAWLVIVSFTFTQASQVVAMTLATAPLASTTAAVVRPNIMYVLDDSGSMAWDYTPDYINDATTAADPGSAGGSAGDGALATIAGGRVTAIGPDGSPASFSHTYSSAPIVIIEGGGGTGASATANYSAATKKITSITVNSGGTGYTSAPYVALVGGLSAPTWGMCWGTSASGSLGGTPLDTTKSPTCTTPSQMVYSTANINYQYYDPAVRYTAPVNADNSSYANATFTAAKQDGYKASTAVNLSNAWTHEVWCNTASPSPAPSAANIATHAQCRENTDTSSDTLYPNVSFNFRKTYTNGPASYFYMQPAEFCTDDTLTNCTRSTAPTSSSGVTYNVPAFYRWCSYYNPLTHTYGNCQSRRDLSHYIPNYLGGWLSTGTPGTQATATMTVNSLAAGQSITGVTIGGVDVVSGATFVQGTPFVFTSAPSGTRLLTATSDVAQAICQTINANTSSTGYGCSQIGSSLILQAAIVGTAANTREVVASGPPDIAAVIHSTGEITVSSAPTNYQITGITLTRTDTTVVPLISSSVKASSACGGSTGVSCGPIAKAICDAINSGPNKNDYVAKSGNPADSALVDGACTSTIDAWVGIKRKDTSSVDNGAIITVSGPPTGTQYPGTITVSSISGPTKIDDIKIGSTSILSSPLQFADGTATSTIASAIATAVLANSNVALTTCSASDANPVNCVFPVATGSDTVSIMGSATLNGALAITAASTQSTAKFRVSNGGTAGYSGSLGYVDVGTTRIVGGLGSSALPNVNNTAANASTLRTQINNGTSVLINGAGPHGFTVASSPVANGSAYDVTVTAPAGNSYNGLSFTFGSGSGGAGIGGAGQPSQWKFKMLGATADNAHITSITCGGTTAVPDRNTGSTTPADNRVKNLANGFNGQTVAGPNSANYSYVCTPSTSPAYHCTLTASGPVAACSPFSITPTAGISVTNNGLINPGSTAPQWTFNISNATAEPKTISSLTCAGTSIWSGTASTGSGTAANHIVNLTSGLTGNGTNGYTYAAIAGAAAGQQRIRITGPNGATSGQPFCNSALSVTYDSPTITLAAVSPSTGLSGSSPGSLTTSTAGSGASATWAFTLSDATTDSKNITSISCGATNELTSSISTGTPSAYITSLVTGLTGSGTNGYTLTSPSSGKIVVTGPTGGTVGQPFCNSNLALTYDGTITLASAAPSSGTISSGSAALVASPAGSAAAAGTQPTYTFIINDATNSNKTITGIACPSGGTNMWSSGSASTGTNPSGSYATTLKNAINATGTTTQWQSGVGGACTSAGTTVSCKAPRTTAAGACPGNSMVAASGSNLSLSNVVQHLDNTMDGGTVRYWYSFDIAGVNAPNLNVSGLVCSGNSAQNWSTSNATSGTTIYWSNANAGYVYNLGNSLVSKVTAAGWSMTCATPSDAATHPSTCTLTGPISSSPPASCAMTNKDSAITLNGSTSSSQTLTKDTGTGIASSVGSAAQWTFNISGATADNKTISAITCGGTNVISTAANTGTYSATRTANLGTGLATSGNWVSGWSASCTAGTSPARNCTITGPSSCTNSTLTIAGSASSGISIGGSALGAGGVSTGSRSPATGGSSGTAAQWTFDIVSSTTDNQTIGGISCNGTATLSANANSGAAATQTVPTRLNNLATFMTSHATGGWTITQTQTADATHSANINVTGPLANSACTWSYTKDAEITASTPVQTAGTGPSTPQWSFDITNATADNLAFGSLSCGGTSLLPSPVPNTGTNTTSAAYQRINNLTGATPPSTSGTVGPTNGYTLSCPPATSSEPQPTCTLTGPIGAPSCTDESTGDFVINKDSSISTGSVTLSQVGSTATGGTEDYAPRLSTVSAFSIGRAGQPTSTTGISSTAISTGTITTNTVNMSSVSPVSVLTIPTNAQGTPAATLVLAGGTDPDVSANHWTRVGVFKRVDIVPTVTSYNRQSGRTDCAGLTCTYAEESQNFANWYSYYRTRENMMKSASTVVFSQLDGNYRIGFDNICNATGTTVLRTAAQFVDSGGEVSNQKTNWWSSLTSTSPACATPLRAETAKIGKYFGHKLGSVADPMQYSCQQNFMILVTDGYWNENEPSNTSLSGTDIGNKDNNSTAAAAPYTAPRPFYDGQQASTTCPGTGGTRSAPSSCRTLADIAWYYYSTDLRSSAFGNTTNAAGDDISLNNVLVTADDQNTAQHMNFFAMGLGIDGSLSYRSDYDTSGVGDFARIKAGTLDWPAVSNLDPSGVDDLWHATVNGHGRYFSARNLPAVVAGLQDALKKIGSRVGSAAAAATSNLEPVAGDNFAYVASYATNFWVGDLQSRSIDVATGNVSPDTNCGVSGSGCQWSAQAKLDDMTYSARRIYLAPLSGTSGNPLRPFTYTDLSATEKLYFDPSAGLSQSSLYATNTSVMTPTNLVNFLRGDRSLEQDGDSSHAQIWRKRSHVLGDIVNTQPIFMKAPSLNYADAGYSNFKISSASTRKPVVFVSSQDGMLHAFNASTSDVTVSGTAVQPGQEMWSFIPRQALANMKVLASSGYTHRYFVDGPITVGDVDFGGGDWHSILVAGLGGGGTEYFALDVTDPLNPAFLWEFTDSSGLGYSFSNAAITKLHTGDWTVMFTSGYNNSDGLGKLFALNPQTGAVKAGFPMSTASGTAGAPSNLGKIAVWTDNPGVDNTAEYVYAGDINGDLWRFDLDPSGSGHTSKPLHKLAHLSNGTTAQPITTKPELTALPDGTRVVFVGTGKYLEDSDKTSTDVQSFYAIKDPLSGLSQPTWDPRTDTVSVTVSGTPTTVPAFLQNKFISTYDGGTTPITQTINGATRTVRKVCRGTGTTVSSATGNCLGADPTTMDWGVYGGWFVDFPDSKERMNVDMKLVVGTLVFATNIPVADSCTVGGSSWVNVLYYKNGLTVPGSDGVVGLKLSDSLVVGVTVVKLSSGQYKAINTKSNYQQETTSVAVCSGTDCGTTSSTSGNTGGFMGKRGLWREFEPY